MEVSDLKKEVEAVFNPAAVKLNLAGPAESSLASTEFSLFYFGDSLGVQVSVDMSQFFIHVLLFRPEGGVLPIGYFDARGKTQKVYLQVGLKSLFINIERETRTLQKLGGDYRNCTTMAKLLADLVVRHWPQLLENAPRWFTP